MQSDPDLEFADPDFAFQRQLVTVRNMTFPDMLESIQRLELIHDTFESKKAPAKSKGEESYPDGKIQEKPVNVNEVDVKEEGTMIE